MRKILIGIIVLWGMMSVTGDAAEPKDHQRFLKDRPTLRDQMVQFLLSMSDLDILKHRDREIDYDRYKDDAQRIVTALTQVKKLDTDHLFDSELKKLDILNKKMLQFATDRNPKVEDYPDKIFQVCFGCHRDYRDTPKPVSSAH